MFSLIFMGVCLCVYLCEETEREIERDFEGSTVVWGVGKGDCAAQIRQAGLYIQL